MKRRDFTLLGLAGAAMLATGSAWAEDTPATEDAPAEDALAPAQLRAKVTAHRTGTTLFVSLSVENVGTEPADVFVKYGTEPAPQLVAALMDGEASFELVPLVWEKGGARTRAGPRPYYEPLAATEAVNVGSYRFTVPERFQTAALQVALTATVQANGAQVQLPSEQVTVAAPEA